MNWLTFHFVSGQSLFSGTALVCVGVILTAYTKRRLGKSAGCVAASAGTVLVVLSSSPYHYWVYTLLLAAAVSWLFFEATQLSHVRQIRLLLRWAFPASCVLLSALELPRQAMFRLPRAQHGRLFVIGDSLSAGIDDSTPRWPALLAERRKIVVVNLAKAGATLIGAMKQAAQIPDGDHFILLEIGGNDLLGGPTPAEFERDLRELLRTVCRPNRVVVMFELPLLPLQARYGRIQRSVAREHGVYLLPKRFLARILTAPGATTDGLHLSAQGSQLMAQVVDSAIGGIGSAIPAGQSKP